MQLLAMLTMLIDHVGKAFFPDQLEWQVIGRISFPLYAYCLVLGYHHTNNINNYMLRLMTIAIVSQYPYMLVFDTNGINVVGSLLIALMVLVALDRYKGYLAASFIIGVAALILEGFYFSYGMYGLFLVLIYQYASKHKSVFLHLTLNILFIYLKGWYIGMYNLASTILIQYYPLLFSFIEKIRIPRWLWRSFYPAHLVVIAALLYLN